MFNGLFWVPTFWETSIFLLNLSQDVISHATSQTQVPLFFRTCNWVFLQIEYPHKLSKSHQSCHKTAMGLGPFPDTRRYQEAKMTSEEFFIVMDWISVPWTIRSV